MTPFSSSKKHLKDEPFCPKLRKEHSCTHVDEVTLINKMNSLEVKHDVTPRECDSSELRRSAQPNLLDVSEVATVVVDILKHVVEPCKQGLINEVQFLAEKVNRYGCLGGYCLQQRGSLFSPLLHHVSDADIQMVSKIGVVSQQQCESLVQFAREHFYLGDIQSIRWEGTDGSKVEVPFASFTYPEALGGKSGFAAFILTGAYRFTSGFLIPVDLALACGGEKREPQQQRRDKIMTKLEEGDFAKVLQKIRALFKKGGVRDSLVKEVNEHIGALRFVTKQFEMVARIVEAAESRPPRVSQAVKEDMSEYLLTTLGLHPGVLSLGQNHGARSIISTAALPLMMCEHELQRRALIIIRKHQSAIETKLLGPQKRGNSIEAYLILDETKY